MALNINLYGLPRCDGACFGSYQCFGENAAAMFKVKLLSSSWRHDAVKSGEWIVIIYNRKNIFKVRSRDINLGAISTRTCLIRGFKKILLSLNIMHNNR